MSCKQSRDNASGFRILPAVTSAFVFAAAAIACPEDGLVAYYPMNGDAMDVSGHGHHGVVTAAVLVADRRGHANSAYSFSGAATPITIPDAPDLGFNVTEGMTIASWVLRTGNGFPQHMFGKRAICSGGAPFWQLALGNGALSTTQLPQGQWVHITQTMAAGSGAYYINGTLSTTFSFFTTSFNPAAPLIIGNSSSGCSPFVGVLDEVRIYNRVLTPAEIVAVARDQTADFNRSGSITVQDVFDFLESYFRGDFSADFDGSMSISVQDIFDFLAFFFGQC